MQLKIQISRLREKLDLSLKNYDMKYEQMQELYKTKMGEYIKALNIEVSEIISGKKTKITLLAPYLAENNRKSIVKAIESVNMHHGETIDMSDTEYHNMISGIESHTEHLTSSYNALGGTHYGGHII